MAHGRRVRRTMRAAPPGELHHKAKLTNAEAADIVRRLRLGERGCDLARRFGVSPTTISQIRTGKIWQTIPRRGEVG